MLKHPLDFNTRKALCVHLGETAGREVANLMFELLSRVEDLERGKVDITPIVRESSTNGLAKDRVDPRALEG